MIKQYIWEHWKHVAALKQITFTHSQVFCIFIMLQFDVLLAPKQIILL